MRLFGRLHESGRTVIVVTHDPRVAELAHRQVHLLDGRIVLDAPTTAIRTPSAPETAPFPTAPFDPASLEIPAPGSSAPGGSSTRLRPAGAAD